jgi:hypothetical protein
MGGRLMACTLEREGGEEVVKKIEFHTNSSTVPRLSTTASRSVEVQFVYFIWWVAFVLDGVLSDRSNTTCQIGTLFVRIYPMSSQSSTGESLGTNILHFGN